MVHHSVWWRRVVIPSPNDTAREVSLHSPVSFDARFEDEAFSCAGSNDVPFAVDSRNVALSDLNYVKMMSCTASARIGVSLLTHPFALLKTRAQTGELTARMNSNSFILFREVFQKEGLSGLYRGWVSATFGGMPAQLIYLGTLEAVAQLLREGQSYWQLTIPPTVSWALSGLGASLVTNTLQAPVDNISQQQQVLGTGVGVQAGVHSPTASSVHSGLTTSQTRPGVVDLARSLGLRGLYRGYFANVSTYGTLSAILWGTWTQLNTWNQYLHISGTLVQRPRSATMSEVEKRASQVGTAWLSAIFAAAVTHPLDQARTRVQVLQPDKMTLSEGGAALTFRGEVVRLLSIITSDPQTFWRGYTRRATAMCISSGMLFPLYDYLKQSSVNAKRAAR